MIRNHRQLLFLLIAQICFGLSLVGSAPHNQLSDKRYAATAAKALRDATQERLKRESARRAQADGQSTGSRPAARPAIKPQARKSMGRLRSPSHENPTDQEADTKSKHSQFTDIALAYSLTLAATAVHEIGHAVALRALYKESQPINVGWTGPGTPSVVSVPGAHLKLPLIPFWGYVASANMGKSPAKDIGIAVAGPILGSLASYGMYKLVKKYYPKEKDLPYTKAVTKGGIVGQLLNLLPIPGFDGATILAALWKWAKG